MNNSRVQAILFTQVTPTYRAQVQAAATSQTNGEHFQKHSEESVPEEAFSYEQSLATDEAVNVWRQNIQCATDHDRVVRTVAEVQARAHSWAHNNALTGNGGPTEIHLEKITNRILTKKYALTFLGSNNSLRNSLSQINRDLYLAMAYELLHGKWPQTNSVAFMRSGFPEIRLCQYLRSRPILIFSRTKKMLYEYEIHHVTVGECSLYVPVNTGYASVSMDGEIDLNNMSPSDLSSYIESLRVAFNGKTISGLKRLPTKYNMAKTVRSKTFSSGDRNSSYSSLNSAGDRNSTYSCVETVGDRNSGYGTYRSAANRNSTYSALDAGNDDEEDVEDEHFAT